jgi:hypothetical protein
MTRLQARKRRINAGISRINPLNYANRPGRSYPGNGIKPVQPETLSRQVLRRMLRDKAHDDIIQQYGMMGRKNRCFVGYDSSFPRRVRRSVIKAIVKRWYAQVLANSDSKRPSEGVLGWFRSKLNIGARANTLKASGVGI